MQGATTLKAGKYQLAAKVWFEVTQDDRGTMLSLSDHQTNVRYFSVIDASGVTIGGSIKPITGEWDGTQEQPRPSHGGWYEVVPSALEINRRWREAIEDPLKCFPAFAKHKFTLRRGPLPRERSQAWPMAGYEGDGGTYILYRRPRYHRGELLLRMLDSNRVILSDETDLNRMPREDWARLLHLTPKKEFTLNGRTWKKMSMPDVAAAVAGQIFEVWGAETGNPEK